MSTMVLPTRKEKIDNLQVLRAVAATLVVWAHGIDVAIRTGSHPFLGYGNLENFGAFGVDVFFVISGFIITASAQAKGASQFARDRFLRVAPIFYVMSAPWIFRALRGGEFSLAPLVPTISFWPIISGKFVEPYLSVGWTLSFEVLFYTAVTLVILLRSSSINHLRLGLARA